MQVQNTRQGYKTVQIQSGRHEEIPENWKVVALREIITDMKTGFASGERDDRGIVQLRMNNISDDGRLEFSKLLKVPFPNDIDQYDLRSDDVLFNNTNSLDLVGKSAIVKEPLDYTFSNHITRIRTNPAILAPYFLFQLFLKYKNQAIFRSICNTHVGQSGVSKNELQRLKIIVPPLQEQQKIASILSKVDDLIQKTEEIIEQTQRLKKGLMQKLLRNGVAHDKFKNARLFPIFSDTNIPDTWQVNPLGEVASLTMGQSPDGITYNSAGVGVPLLNGPTEFGITYPKPIQFTSAPTRICDSGDILLCVRGSTTGRMNLADRQYCIGRGLAAIKGKKGKINTMWLYNYLLLIQQRIYDVASGGGSTFPNINGDEISKIMLPCPPIEEQLKISSVLETVENLVLRNIQYRDKIILLKKGLMQKLLTGQIQVKI